MHQDTYHEPSLPDAHAPGFWTCPTFLFAANTRRPSLEQWPPQRRTSPMARTGLPPRPHRSSQSCRWPGASFQPLSTSATSSTRHGSHIRVAVGRAFQYFGQPSAKFVRSTHPASVCIFQARPYLYPCASSLLSFERLSGSPSKFPIHTESIWRAAPIQSPGVIGASGFRSLASSVILRIRLPLRVRVRILRSSRAGGLQYSPAKVCNAQRVFAFAARAPRRRPCLSLRVQQTRKPGGPGTCFTAFHPNPDCAFAIWREDFRQVGRSGCGLHVGAARHFRTPLALTVIV